ncbi:hypothetical protein [Hahella ganghwensis]|uniref:hypothetical protein n=1 Tax=Hahella ganghwensis TaxID=286420 RepID=UPI0012F97829|nr:hypothetical protein [Hahella ganghwensis]
MSELESHHDITMAHGGDSEVNTGKDNFSRQAPTSNQVFEGAGTVIGVESRVNAEHVLISHLKESSAIQQQVYASSSRVNQSGQTVGYGVTGASSNTGGKTPKPVMEKDIFSSLVKQVTKYGSQYSLTNVHLTHQGNKLTVWIRDFQQSDLSKAEEILALISDAIKDTEFEVEKVMLNGRSLADVKQKGVIR